MPAKNKIYYLKGGGRFGNQLLNTLHLLAYAFENQNIQITNMGLIEYNDLLYDHNKASFYIDTDNVQKYPFFIRFILWLQSKGYHKSAKHFSNLVIYLLFINPAIKRIKYKNRNYKDFEMDSPAFSNTLKKYKEVSFWGWGFRCWKLVEKHEEAVRKWIMPNSVYFQNAKTFVSNIKMEDEFLIGVLIRYTDYRQEWFNGKYYFAISVYEKWIVDMYELLAKEGKKIKFIICSDEPQQMELLKEKNIPFVLGPGHATGENHYIENMYTLAFCNLILTPPSTFSAMAAFLGNVPVILLKNSEQKISATDIFQNHIFEMRNDKDGLTSVN